MPRNINNNHPNYRGGRGREHGHRQEQDTIAFVPDKYDKNKSRGGARIVGPKPDQRRP